MSTRPTRRQNRRRILYNMDGGQLLNTPTPEVQVDDLADTQVDTLLLCVQYGMNYIFPDGCLCQFPAGGVSHFAPDYLDRWRHAFAGGNDPHRRFIRRCRELGKEILITFRMNEGHDLHRFYLEGKMSELFSPFWQDHPEYRIGGDPDTGWCPYFLDYGRPEVREYYLARLDELMRRFDADGFELDFLRFPFFFSDAMSRDEACAIMTGHVRDVRAVLDRVAGPGKRLLAARVPSSLADCRTVGLDPEEWRRQELIDFLTASSQHYVDFDFPVEEFKRALPGLPVYAGIDVMGNQHPVTLTAAMFRAAAANALDRGADGIYLFNHIIPHLENTPPETIREQTDILREIGELRTLRFKPKHYLLNNVDGWCQHLKRFVQLPFFVVLAPGIPTAVTFHLADDPADLAENTMRVVTEGMNGRNLGVRINGQDLGYGEEPLPECRELFPILAYTRPNELKPLDLTACRDYIVPASVLRHGRNRIGFYVGTYNQVMIKEVELAVNPAAVGKELRARG